MARHPHGPGPDGARSAPMERVLDQLPEVFYRCRIGEGERCELLSSRFVELTGFEREVFLGEGGQSLIDLVHEEDKGRVVAEYARAAERLRPFVLHYRIVRANGEVRDVCERGGVLEDEDGRRIRHGAMLDETERLWAERELEEHTVELTRRTRSQGRLLSLLREISELSQTLLLAPGEQAVYPVIADVLARGTEAPFVAFYMIGGGWSGAGTAASQSELLGYEEMASAGPAAGETGQPPKWQSIAQGLVGEAVRGSAVLVVTGDEVPGAPEWKARHHARAAMVFPLMFQQGPAGALLVLDREPYAQEMLQGVDLLAREAVAALLSAHRAEQLKLEVSRRRELIEQLRQANEGLVRATTRAEQANRMKSRFLANVSHEIRTPLNGILGMAELLTATELSAEQEDSLLSLRSCADALLLLLNDILDLSKIEAGKLELEEVEYGLSDVVDGALEAVAVRAHERGIEIDAVVDPELPDRLIGDPSRLRQVFTNLLGNAVKFTERGHVVLRTALEVDPEAGPTIQVTIEDTGIGIPQERAAAIFEPFVQAESSTNRRFGGTGLGLAICRQLVEMMGGRIGCESEVGEGSRFTVRIPLVPVDAAPALAGPGEGIQALVLGPAGIARDAAERQLLRAGATLLPRDADASGAEGTALLVRLAVDGDTTPARTMREEHAAWQDAGGALLILADPGRRDTVDVLRGDDDIDVLWRPLRASTLGRALRRAAGLSGPLTGPTQEEVPESLEGMRILLAEDHPVNQKLATKMLERAGCRVTVAADGRQAVQAFTREPFDAVLMDMQMPELDGLGATREIRALGGAATRVPIIALTANAMKGDREACLESGMSGYLTKPMRYEELVEALREAVRETEDALVPA